MTVCTRQHPDFFKVTYHGDSVEMMPRS